MLQLLRFDLLTQYEQDDMLLWLFCYLKKNSSYLQRFWDIDYPLFLLRVIDKKIYAMRCDMLIKLKVENVFMDLLH